MVTPELASWFDEIYSTTNKELLLYITSKCGSISDVSDIFQDTYMELFQVLCKRGRDYVTNGRALLYKIAKRKIARYYSLSVRLRMFIPLNAIEDEESGLGKHILEPVVLSTEEIAVNQTMLEEAKNLIKQKSEDVRKVFMLFYEVGLTIPEIAQALSISESNVKHKLYRTLNELRELLK